MKPRCITVCVGYDDILKLTLQSNMRFLDECIVVTSYDDIRTIEFASSIPGVTVFQTDAFTRHGAKFNKGLAIEESFDFAGREGWLLILDADIVLPDSTSFDGVETGFLYGARRRILDDPAMYRQDMSWKLMSYAQEKEIPGFFQLFNTDDPVLTIRPWYDPTFVHAGGGDSYFQSLWKRELKKLVKFDVLHLGPRDTNWFGRVSKRIDGEPVDSKDVSSLRKTLMDKLKASNGWVRGRLRVRLKDRVKIPGFQSNFQWFKSNPDTDTMNQEK